MSIFTWIARPTKCKFGGHDLMKSIKRPDGTKAIILTICTQCDYESDGVEIKLKNGRIPVVEIKDPYYVRHQVHHEVVRWCETCEESRIVLPQIYRCVYCKGNLVD